MHPRLVSGAAPVNIAAAAQRVVRIVLLANGMMIRMQQHRVQIVLPVNIAMQAAKRLVKFVLLVPTQAWAVVSLAIAFRAPPA
jgi:hypothetical protein